MAHDANFAGKHLRLTAFLRVLENGMPQRPSRFKRHGQVVNEPYIAGQNDIAVDRVAVDASPAIQTTRMEALPTTNQSRSDSPIAHQIREKEKAKHRTNVKKESSTQHNSSNIPEGRLSVNGLALLRTTTSDGLPDPCDARTAFAPSATDLDPIEDSQNLSLTTATWLSLRQSQNEVIFIDPENQSTLTQAPRMCDIVKVKPESSRTSKGRIPLGDRPIHHTSTPRSGFASGFDGFVGSELGFIRKKKSRGRHKAAPIRTKLTATNRSLVLANGLLPVPSLEAFVGRSQVSFRPSSSGSACISGPAPLLPLKLSVVTGGNEQDKHAYQRESTIQKQLFNITAPAPRFGEFPIRL